jgi:hypothetical protein
MIAKFILSVLQGTSLSGCVDTFKTIFVGATRSELAPAAISGTT